MTRTDTYFSLLHPSHHQQNRRRVSLNPLLQKRRRMSLCPPLPEVEKAVVARQQRPPLNLNNLPSLSASSLLLLPTVEWLSGAWSLLLLSAPWFWVQSLSRSQVIVTLL